MAYKTITTIDITSPITTINNAIRSGKSIIYIRQVYICRRTISTKSKIVF